MRRQLVLVGVLVGLAVGLPEGAVRAQGLPSILGGSAAPAATATPEPLASLQKELAGIKDEIAAVEGQLRRATGPAASTSALRDHLFLLQRLQGVLEKRQAAEQQLARLEAEGAVPAEAAAAVPASGPVSLDQLDALYDAVAEVSARAESAAAQEDAAGAAVDLAQQQLNEARGGQPTAEQAGEPTAGGGSDRQLRPLRERLAKAVLELRQSELNLAQRQSAGLQAQQEALQQLVPGARKRLRLTESDLDSRLAALAKQEAKLKDDLSAGQQTRRQAEQRLSEARERLGDTSAMAPAAREELEARRLEAEAAENRTTFLAWRLQRVELLRELWKRRVQVLGGTTEAGQISTWQRAVGGALDELAHEQRLLELWQQEAEHDLDAVRAHSGESGVSAAAGRWLDRQANLLEPLIDRYRTERGSLDSSQRLLQRFKSESTAARHGYSLWQRVGEVAHRIVGVWRYDLVTVGDKPLTLGELITALVIIFLGIWVSRRLSRLLSRRVFRRLGLEEGAIAAYQTLVFYVLVVFFVMVGLKTARVPLTMFTVLGGALAIGVGFGSQNIVNNFISGLILLAERPIRVGDMVEVEGTSGVVERIGPRSTRVRSFDNIHLIVPNSTFLEQMVVNWTLTDEIVRVHVDVGVAYGSPTARVKELLEKVVTGNESVLENPAPVVLFEEFGDNSLLFTSYFWIRMHSLMQRRRIASDIRFEIDHVFREAGIVIAFPQRDVHLDTLKPLDVRILGREGQAPPGGSPPTHPPGEE